MLWPGTHLKNISVRDMSQFRQGQGATTKAYSMYSKEEPTQVLHKLAISLRGCGDFLLPLRYRLVGVAQGYTFLVVPRGYDKIARNAGWKYF